MLERALEATDKYKWVLLLLPGILTIGCLGLVTNILKLTELQIFLLGSLISIPMLLLVGSVLYLGLAILYFVVWFANSFTTLTLRAPQVREQTFWIAVYCLAVFLSPIVGANLAVLLERDALHRAASAITFIGKLDASSIWSPLERLRYSNTNGLLSESEGLDGRTPIPGRKSASRTGDVYFEIHLKGGEGVFVGWPRAYGLRGAESEIYLSPACEIREKQLLSAVAGPGVVIKEREIAFVLLVDRKDRIWGKEHECWTLTRDGVP